MQSIQVPGNF